jgi:NAD+ synthase (glutamine-hydrolysing)
MDEERVSLGALGLLRVAAAVPLLRVSDVAYNVEHIESLLREAEDRHVQVIAFPELAITGYTCGDLFLQQALLDRAESGLNDLVRASAAHTALIVVGCPVRAQGRLFNAAVVLQAGEILGVVPKTYIPNYREFYEERWFSSAREAGEDQVELCGQMVPFGTDLLFRSGSVTMGVEICEDLWIPLSPHEFQAHAGANLLVNISASNEVIGKAEWRRTMVSSESGRCIAAYIYTSSGFGESTNDVIYGGHAMIAENGVILRESERYQRRDQLIVQDVDVGLLVHDRRLTSSFADGIHNLTRPFRSIRWSLAPVEAPIERVVDAHPFVPSDPKVRDQRCEEIFHDLVIGLATKLVTSGQAGEMRKAAWIPRSRPWCWPRPWTIWAGHARTGMSLPCPASGQHPAPGAMRSTWPDRLA